MSLSIDNENKRSLHKPAVMYARSACFINDDLVCNDGEGEARAFTGGGGTLESDVAV